MKVLVVCSGTKGYLSPFIKEQMESLSRVGVEFELFQIMKRGVSGYLSSFRALNRKIKLFKPDIIHAHYGLSGMLSVLQRNTPVIITFHGSDIRAGKLNKIISFSAAKLSRHNIFVTKQLAEMSGIKSKYSVIPCGVDLDCFKKMDKVECRSKMMLDLEKKYILFSSAFDVPVKNFQLAKDASDRIENSELLELKGYSRDKVNLLLNACDILLVTSFYEGSPQIVKEALASGCSIVSTDVGDIRDLTENTGSCFLTEFSVEDVASKIKIAFRSSNNSDLGRKRIKELGLSLEDTAKKILEIYQLIVPEVK